MCVCSWASQSGSLLRSFTLPLCKETHTADLLSCFLFPKSQCADYIKCLWAAEMLPSRLLLSFCLSFLLISSSCRAVLSDRRYCFALRIAQHIAAVCNAINHFKSCHQVSILLKNTRMWFQWFCMLERGFVWGRQWLKIMPSHIWNDIYSHTASFLSSPQFGPWVLSQWVTTDGMGGAISNRKQNDVK